MRGLVLLAACLAGASSLPAQSPDPAEIAGRASRLYRGLTSLRASFQQTIEDRMIGTVESRGDLVQAGNARLAMRFSDPKGDLIILDGQYVWLYTPSTTPGQVIRMALPNDPVYGPNVLGRILDRPADRYELTWLRQETVDGAVLDVVQFVPTSADPLFLRAVIWIDRATALPRRLELDERSGVHRTLALSRIRTNTTVRPSEFVFDIPNGTRVVDR